MADDHKPARAKVFISYSRKDAAFAERLVASFSQARFMPLIDRESILPGEAWKERLSRLVLECDTVVFIITPDSVVSPVCGWELGEAQRHSKRLLPIVYRRVPDGDIPEAAQAINWIDFSDEGRIDAALETLQSALIADIGWLREHTRIEELASHWLGRGRAHDALLRGDSLTRAEVWKRLHDPAARPAITRLQEEYLTESRIVFDREERERIAQINEAFIAQSRFLNERAHKYWSDKNDYVSAALILLEAMPSDEDAVIRPLVAETERVLNVLTRHFPEETVATVCERGVLHGRLSGDAKLIATSCADGTVRVSDLEETGAREKLVVEHGHVGDMALEHERYGSGGRMTATAFGAAPQNYDFSASSRLFAVAHSDQIEVWDLPGKAKVLKAKASRNVVCFHPQREELFFVDARGHPVIWDAEKKAICRDLKRLRGSISQARFSARGDQVLTRDSQGNCSIFSTGTGKRVGNISRLSGALLDWERDGARIVAGDPEGRLQVWAPGRFTQSWRLDAEPPKIGEQVILARFIKGARHIVLVTKSGAVHAYDAPAQKLLHLQRALPSEVLHCSLSEDYTTLICACANGSVVLRSVLVSDPAAAREMAFGGHSAPVTFIGFSSRSNNAIISASVDGTCRSWTTEGSSRGSTDLAVPGAFVTASCYAHDGSVLLSIWSDEIARTVDASNGAFLDEIPLGKDAGQRIPEEEVDEAMRQVSKLSDFVPEISLGKIVALEKAPGFLFMGDGGVLRYNYSALRVEREYPAEAPLAFSVAETANMLAVLSSDGNISMFDLETGQCKRRHAENADPIEFCAMYPDGRLILTISKSRAVVIRDAASFQVHAVLDTSEPARFAWISADCKRLVTITPSGQEPTLWDAESGAKIKQMHLKWLARGAAFSPDAAMVVTYAKDPVAVLWSATDGKEIFPLSGPNAHSDDVVAASFSADGSRVLTAARDGSARLWSVASGEQTNTLLGGSSPVVDAKLSPRGNSVFTAWQDGRARLWAVPSTVKELVNEVRRSVPRALTPAERQKLFLREEPPKWAVAQKKWPYDGAEVTKTTATLYRIGGTGMPIMIAGNEANTVRIDEFALHDLQAMAASEQRKGR